MKQYKIDAFKGYEKFMKKIGRKEGYICYIYWPFKNRLTLKLIYANYWAKKPKDGHLYSLLQSKAMFVGSIKTVTRSTCIRRHMTLWFVCITISGA